MKNITLCPIPKSIKIDSKNIYKLSENLSVFVDNIAFLESVKTAIEYFSIPASVTLEKSGAEISVLYSKTLENENYCLSIDETGIKIEAGDSAGAFYGLITLNQILIQAENELPFLEIEDSPHFKIRGFMFDISRCKVPTLHTLKQRVDLLCSLKINHLQLYFDGAPFEYKDYPDMWEGFEVLKGEEILELDEYCKQRFIELLPAQNTFGHMGQWLFDGGYSHLAECPNGFTKPKEGEFVPWPLCLDPQDPKAFQLVENISNDLLRFFSSDKYNVCCDETIELGLGKSKELCEKIGIGRVYFNYLMKLYDYCKKNKKQMLFWADIINEYPEIVAELPKDILVLNWGYYNDLPKEESCVNFEKNNIQYCVCPGTAVWNTQIGNIPQMLDNTKTTILKGYNHSAIGVVNTEWGDGGHWQGTFSAYPGIVYGAAMSWQPVINENLQIEQVLNTLIFKDKAKLIGKIFMEAGSFMEKEGIKIENTSHSLIILKSNINEYAIPEKLTHNDFKNVTEFLSPVLTQLDKCELDCEDGETVVEELRVGIKLILTAQNMGHYKLFLNEKNEEKAKIYAKYVQDGLNSALTNLTKLWLKKNKVSKLHNALYPLVNNCNLITKFLHPDNVKPE